MARTRERGIFLILNKTFKDRINQTTEGNGKSSAVRFFKDLGRTFKDDERVIDYVISEGPHPQIRLVSEKFMLDVERLMDSTVCVRRINPSTTKTKRVTTEDVFKGSLHEPESLITFLEGLYPLPTKKTSAA